MRSMRGRWRYGLIAILVLLGLFGAYAVYWHIVAGRIVAGLDAWRGSAEAHKIRASWQSVRVAGFPFAFRIELADAALRNDAWSPPPRLRAAQLTAIARPWNFDVWRLRAPQGFTAALAAAGGRPALKLSVGSAQGVLAPDAGGGSRLWIGARDIAAEAAAAVPIRSADAWVILPAQPAAKDTDPDFAVALDAHDIGIEAPPVNFAKVIDELALGVTVKGPFPPGQLEQSAAAWRDAGGTIEVENLRVEWGGLGISANGTLALDRQLQPVAAFSSGIEGFDKIIDALVAADWLIPEQGSLVKIALGALSRPGPDGKPQLTAPFTIQNGKMYLGPARLGTAPRIAWE